MRPPKAAHSPEQCHHQQVGGEVQIGKTVQRKKSSGSPRSSGQRRWRLEWPSPSRKKNKTKTEMSLRHRAQSLCLKKSSLNVILGKDLHLRPYRIKSVKNCSRGRRVKMANSLTEHPAGLDQVWFSDEANFWLDGQVNPRNVLHWVSATPDKVLTNPFRAQKVSLDDHEARKRCSRAVFFSSNMSVA